MGLALRKEIGVEGQQEGFTLHLDPTGPLPPTSTASPLALVLGAILILFQVLDGIFTSMGISRFGVAMEGNPLLRMLMIEFGHIPTLAVVKCLAILVIVFIVYAARRVSWVHRVLGIVTLIYLFAAILPWAYILLIEQA